MLRKLRKRLEEVRAQKFQHFRDFEPLIRKILNDYGYLFPQFEEKRSGSSFVFHFNVEGVAPISLEKEHGNRDCIPRRFAKFAIQGIDDVLTFIEAKVPDGVLEEEQDNEGPVADEAAGILPEPKVPDRDSGG
jgi:hypothetical protein